MSTELYIPSLHAWEWRAEELLRKRASGFRRSGLPEEVSTFFGSLDRYRLQPQELDADADPETRIPKQKLSEHLGSLVVRKRMPLKNYPHVYDTEVRVRDVDGFREALSVPISSTTHGTIHNGIGKEFRLALDYLIDATMDGTIYKRQGSSQFSPIPSKISLGALIDSFDGDFEATQVNGAAHAYDRHIRALPYSEIIETVQFHETIQAIDFSQIEPK